MNLRELFGRREPRPGEIIVNGVHMTETIFPHCDPRVLHAPGECKYCDLHPEWQHLRVVWGVCYTGQVPTGDMTPCPSEINRSLENIEAWHGNVATPHD